MASPYPHYCIHFLRLQIVSVTHQIAKDSSTDIKELFQQPLPTESSEQVQVFVALCVCGGVLLFQPRNKQTKSIFELRREKTGLQGFRPGPTQTGLFKHRRRQEA